MVKAGILKSKEVINAMITTDRAFYVTKVRRTTE